MRLARFAVSTLLLLNLGRIALGQEVAPGGYRPPATLERSLIDDPAFSDAMGKFYASGDLAGFRAFIQKRAADGNLLAEFFLGAAYIPPECTFLPFKNAPSDCPGDPPKGNSLGLTLSFEEAIHWLKLASAQGSGEASEMLAQVMERAIRSSASSEYQMTDVAHFHAVARAQGYDLQDVEYSCYSLDEGRPADRLVMADKSATAEFLFSPQELDALHAAGASGTLRWRGTADQSVSVALRHPEGPRVHIRVILAHAVRREVAAPLPNRVDATFVQIEDRIVTVPSSYPQIARVVMLRPSTKEDAGGAEFQSIDGTFSNGCSAPAGP